MDNDDIPPPRLRFDELTRRNLLARLRKAIIETGNSYDCDNRCELLVLVFEGLSYGYKSLSKHTIEKQERRRDRLVSIANHIDGIQTQLSLLDDAAKEYTWFVCFNELIRVDNPDHKTPDTYDIEDMLASASFSEMLPKLLSAYEKGIRESERTLPFHSQNQSGTALPWYMVNHQLRIAMEVEKIFFDNRLKFSITKTGVAADCLNAIYSLAGLNVDRVDYWLKQARDHKDSMASFVKRHKQPEN